MKTAGKSLFIASRIGLIVALSFTLLVYGPRTAQAQTTSVKGKIAFETSRDGYEQIYVMDSDGSNQTSLSGDPTHDDYFPSWTPDGTQIIFVSYHDNKAHIVAMEPDGSKKTVLFETANHIEQASLSPDGKLLVYAYEDDAKNAPQHFQIYTVGVDGKNPVNVSKSKNNDKNPAWSPDGKQIIFTSSGDGKFHIHVINADGSNDKDISTNEGFGIDHDPAWSPDGKHIAFTGTTFDGQSRVFVMDADGSNRTQLPGKRPSNSPSWSPDGKQIAYVSFPEGSSDGQIFVMNADGSNPTNISNSKSGESHPAWMPASSPVATPSK